MNARSTIERPLRRRRELLDTAHAVETPEGVELHLCAAGPAVRAGAWLLDALVRVGIYALFGVLFSVLGGLGQGLMMIVVFIGEWFYGVLFEVLQQGQTPGKRAAGLRVVHDDGTPVSWNASLLRNLLRFADFLPFGYGFGVACMSIHPRFKRLGDLVAGTLVVYADSDESSEVKAAPLFQPAPATSPSETRQPVPASAGRRPAPQVPAWVAPVLLEPSERAALLAFYDRAGSWTHERQIELSARLEPLTGATGELGLTRALGLGAWLRGSAS